MYSKSVKITLFFTGKADMGHDHGGEGLLGRVDVPYRAHQNYSVMEYELAYTKGSALQDSKLIKVASALSKEWYNKPLSILDVKERVKLVVTLHKRYMANQYQISRILGLDRSMISNLLGK